jgi:ATP-dependent Zn protease
MDDKSDRRFNLEHYWRHHGIKSYKHHTVSKFLKEHKQSVVSSVLIVIILVLLIGTFSQLQDPNTSNPPPDVTIVDYNTFVEQVRASNILSVTIQGKEITGTLEHTLQGQTCSTPPATQTYDPSTGMQLWLSAPTPSTCTIFTYLPVQGDFALMPLLLSPGVVVNTLPAK